MTSRFKNRLTALALYTVAALCALYALWQLRGAGLLPKPYSNMDQSVISRTAVAIAEGNWPDFTQCRYSPLYVAFLSLAAWLAGGELVLMRAIQALVFALTPAVIFRAGRELRFGKQAALLGAVFFLFSPTAVLLSLDFLRAGFLALLFSCFLRWAARTARTGGSGSAWLTGLLGGALILGRENFCFLLLIPFFLLLFPRSRKAVCSMPKGVWLRIASGAAAAILPVCLYNAAVSGRFAVIPDNAGVVLTYFYGDTSLSRAFPEILARFPGRLYDMVCSYEIPNSLSVYAHRAIVPFLNIFCLPFNLLLIFAAGALVLRPKKEVIFLALLCAGYFGSLSFVEIFYRFRLPILPAVALGAGVFAGRFGKLLRCEPKKAGAGIVLIAVLFSLTWQTPERRMPKNEWRAIAGQLLNADRLEEAERFLKRARRYGKTLPQQEMQLLSLLLQSDPEHAAELAAEWRYQFRRLPEKR